MLFLLLFKKIILLICVHLFALLNSFQIRALHTSITYDNTYIFIYHQIWVVKVILKDLTHSL